MTAAASREHGPFTMCDIHKHTHTHAHTHTHTQTHTHRYHQPRDLHKNLEFGKRNIHGLEQNRTLLYAACVTLLVDFHPSNYTTNFLLKTTVKIKPIISFIEATTPSGPRPPHHLGLAITPRRSTLDRIPLDV